MKCEVASNAQYLADHNGNKTIAIQDFQNGKMVILPSNFCKKLIEPRRIVRRNFPSPNQKFPSEEISQISTGSIRHIVEKALIYLSHSRRLPFVQLWFFPNGGKSVFAFRVDTDSASKAQIEALYQVCRSNHISAAWFVDTKSHENWIDYFAGMKDQEIGYHCYTHRIYPGTHATHLDMEKGLSILESIGIKLRGYAAPFGEWNVQLGELIQKQGFAYSSEFGCAYDDLPFFPFLETDFSTALQVPIHPISTRSLFLAKYNEQQMLEYYLQVIQQKLFLNEPVIFYHHPVHGHVELFDQIFKEVNRRNIPMMNLNGFQSWWRKRCNTRWSAQYENGRFTLNSTNGDSSVWAKTHFPDGGQTLIPLNDPEKRIPFENQASPALLNYDPQKLRRFGLRTWWHDIESRYGKLKH